MFIFISGVDISSLIQQRYCQHGQIQSCCNVQVGLTLVHPLRMWQTSHLCDKYLLLMLPLGMINIHFSPND